MKKIRNIDRYVSKNLQNFRIASPEITEEHKIKLCLEAIANGMTFIPKIIGPITKINVEGYEIVRKDLPKENRYICDIEWHLRDWGGHMHSGFAPIYRDCYPREFVKPLEKELIVYNNQFFSEEIERNKNNEEEIKHTINMFLEIFGEFEIVQKDFSRVSTIKRVDFEILPPGEYPFKKILEHAEKYKSKGSIPYEMLEERLKFYQRYNIKEYIVGIHGYQGYFGFEIGNKIIFDNNRYANAIYVFDIKAKEFCKLTKKEVIESKLCIDRIIHGRNWKEDMAKILLRYVGK